MTFIRTLGNDEAEGTVAKAFAASIEATGGVFETTRLLSIWPELLLAEQRRYNTVMLEETALTRAEKEMIACAVSAANRCRYCIAHHTAMLIEAGTDAGLANAIADDYPAADLPARQRAMLDFATTDRPDQSNADTIEAMRRLGFDDRQLLEIVIVAGFFHDYNLRVSMFGLELEDWAGQRV